MVTTRPPKTIVKPTAFGPVANTDTKLLIYGLFQKGRVLAQDGTLERGPCRKPSGGGSDRYSLSQKALRLISECSSTGTSFRLSQSGGSSGASDSWLETIRKRAKQAINVQFGAIFELIVSFLRLIAQTMRRRSTPRSRLRRRRIAEFELAKPRIHPAEFYGGDEDDSADGPVQGAIRVWKP